MDINFLAAANSITNAYLNHDKVLNAVSSSKDLDEETKKSFGAEFEQDYDSMMATKMLSSNLRESYDAMHPSDFKEHANRLGYSIDNRVIDMLHLQITDDMNSKISDAMNNALDELQKQNIPHLS